MVVMVACILIAALAQAANEQGSPQTSTSNASDIAGCPSYCMKQAWTKVDCVGSQQSDCQSIPWYIASQNPGTCVQVESPVPGNPNFDPWYSCN